MVYERNIPLLSLGEAGASPAGSTLKNRPSRAVFDFSAISGPSKLQYPTKPEIRPREVGARLMTAPAYTSETGRNK